ncbi:MAG: dihydrofolate reductase family protein [Nitrospirae bacterium]|nr:dihydrofolate reductase family protein [Nitrospirota bacterium]
MTAIGTVKADDPELTARIKGGKNPVRIVIDPELEIPVHSKVLRVPPETIIVTKDREETRDTSKKIKANNLITSGIKMISFKETLHLSWLMERLGEMGITSLLIEGGSSLNAHALEDGIVDKLMFFIAPNIIGGRESYPAVGGRMFRRLDEAYKIKDISVRRLGEDILVEGYL